MSKGLVRSASWIGCLALAVAVGLGVFRFAASSPTQESALKDELPLDESERAYLWDIEHHGQLLSQRGFKLLGKALRQADRAALQNILASDFAGSTLSKPREIKLPGNYAQVVRQEDQQNSPQSLGRDDFVARLLEYRRDFGQPPEVGISLMTLLPKDRRVLDGEWEGTCVLRMWGETAAKAPAEVMLSMRYRLARPTEELFQSNGWLKSCAITQTLTGKAPHYLLREVAVERGIDPKRLHDNWETGGKQINTGGVFLCDYDRDGVLDMLLTDVNGCFLYKGLPGGKFKDVTSEVGLPTNPQHKHPTAFADLDGDGWDDLVLGDRLYHNQPDNKGGRRFIAVPVALPDGGQVIIGDYDRDGRLDLYFTRSSTGKVGSWVTGESGEGRGNVLLRNRGNWDFEDVTVAAGAAARNRSCFSAVWLDADNDGWPDLYVINEFGKGVFLSNQKNGTFREHLLSDGPSDFGTMGVTCGDIDNDGYIDIYCANMYSKAGSRVLGNLRPDAYPPDLMATMRRFVTGSQLWRNQGQLKFEQKGPAWQVASVGWAYGAALADLDNDGWLDLYATAGFISADRTEPDG